MGKKQLFLLAATLLIIAGPVSMARAAVTVVGSGDAKRCFDAAESQRYGKTQLLVCTQALSDDLMTVRDRAATLVNRGIIKMGLRDLEGAIEDYQNAIKLRNDMGESYVNLGIAFIYQKRDKDAVETISKGLALNPSRQHVGYYMRGVAYELAGNAKAAYSDYARAAELAPEWKEPKVQLERFKLVPRQAAPA